MMSTSTFRLLQYFMVLSLLCGLSDLPAWAQPATQSSSYASSLPPARRVFSADLDRDGSDELLIAHNTQLSAWRWSGQGWVSLWSTEGPGVAQITLWDQRNPKLWVAWGMGKGKMKAPITLSALDPLTGEARHLWTYQGSRSQTVELQWVEVDQDPQPELMIVHFVNKYHTRRVILDQLNATQPSEYTTPSIRMGTSWLIADLDGRPGLEELIGRVYGDVKGEYGDLSVQPFSLKRTKITLGTIMPTERGLKQIAYWPELPGEVYFSDGWVAAYGKKAKATLKRLRWIDGRPIIERLVDSTQEFTFFDFWRRRDPKSGRWLIFTQGNRSISVITPKAQGPWSIQPILKTPPIVNAAIGYAGDHWWAFTPHETGAQAHRLSLPTDESR